jgi:flavin-binding protein dodecin
MNGLVESGAVKVIEVIGISSESFQAAVSNAAAKAAESISGITDVEVLSLKAAVNDGKVVQYRATVKLAFTVR